MRVRDVRNGVAGGPAVHHQPPHQVAVARGSERGDGGDPSVELQRALARTAAQLRALTDASAAIHAADSLEAALREAASRACAILGVARAEATATDPDGGGLLHVVATPEAVASSGRGAGHSHSIPPRVSGGMTREAPLVGRDGVRLGTIRLQGAPGTLLSESDAAVLAQLAQLTQVALENRRLVALAEREMRRAEEANRAKDEFLAVVSHELRTPLNAIVGWTQMLRGGTLAPDKRARALEAVDRNARAQLQLVEDLLDVSRIISGKLRIEPRPMDVVPVIEAAVDAVRPPAEARGVALVVALPPLDGARVMGDAGRLQQVVCNLLVNAVKFTPTGGRVELATRLDDLGGIVEICVRDTGRGISPEFLPQVFERFRQADSSSTRLHGGLGLGLSIARHLVELHGGTIRVASEGEGRGAVFTITLPLCDGDAYASPDTGQFVLPPGGLRPPESLRPAGHHDGAAAGEPATGEHHVRPLLLAGVRVVLVDDEEDARAWMTEVLAQHGADVTAVASAAAAFAELGRGAPDVLLSDIGMPDEDGYALIRRVRARDDASARVPAAALTAYASSEDRRRARAAGFHTHVPKPVDPAALVALVARLSGRNAPRAAEG